ncbi:MAG: D-3-phosphoglycerate dehydrogenase SerA [Promethearchaeota archaeon]
MKAFVTAPLTKEGLDRLRERMEVTYEPWHETREFLFSAKELVDKLAGVDVFVSEADNLSAEVIEATSLKIIALARNDPNTIDLPAATRRGIPVLYAPQRNSDSVADLAVCLILALARKLVQVDRFLHSGEFEVSDFEDWVSTYTKFTGFELGGKTVGIVGFGGIGRRVAARLRPFGVKLLAYDPYAPDGAFVEHDAKKVDLEELMRQSDVVTIHAAPTDETNGLISEDLIKLMKPTAVFVNTAKGSIVDEEALLEALQDGRIAGAALDVFQVEPLDEDNEFLELENCIVLPHFGGNTDAVVRNQTELVVNGLLALLDGKEPPNVINPEVLPGFFGEN